MFKTWVRKQIAEVLRKREEEKQAFNHRQLAMCKAAEKTLDKQVKSMGGKRCPIADNTCRLGECVHYQQGKVSVSEWAYPQGDPVLIDFSKTPRCKLWG